MESRDLFLWTWQFFADCLVMPGGMLLWLGSLLTQFLYFPALGAALLTILCALTARAYRKTFHTGHAEAAIPVMLLIAALMHTGYMIWKVKMPGMAFVPMLGFLAATLGARWFKKTGFNVLMMADWVLIWFPLLGYWCLLGTATMAVMFCAGKAKPMLKVKLCLWALFLMLLSGHIWYEVMGGTRPDTIFLAALPLFPTAGKPFLFMLPYLLACLYLAISPVLFRKGSDSKGIGFIPVFIAAAAVVLFWNKDGHFRREMRMAAATERCDWEKVLKAAPKYGSRCAEPTRVMVLYKDMALFELGREGDEAFKYIDGNTSQKSPMPINTALQAARPLYQHYGIPAYCYRWCFESYAETGWSYEDFEYMTRSCLVREEWATAEKYIGILKHTLFHRGWAKRQEALCGNVDAVKNSDTYKLDYSMRCNDGWLDNDSSQPEMFLSSYFTHHMQTDASADWWRAAMLWSARTCDSESFLDVSRKYLQACRPDHIPTHWQEALLLHSWQAGMKLNTQGLDEEVRKNFFSYQKYCSDHSPENSSEKDFGKYFGNTYYNFFHFGKTNF